MGNKTFRRLEDFGRHGADMMARCDNCGHKGALDPYKVFRWFALHNWNVAIEVVPDHMRCSICRRRPTALIPVPRAETRESDRFFPRDEDGWKRLQRRLRG
jgi:hypothetical protein